MSEEDGQSLIEVALALPLLLVVLVGLMDVGRAFYFTTTIANGAREGAALAARDASASDASVQQRVCDESGLVDRGGACPPAITVARSSTAGDVTVDVSYAMPLISAGLARNVLGGDTLALHVAASFPRMQVSP